MVPRPQVGGRAGLYRLARAGGDAIHLLLIASPRSLTAFVRYRHDACLLTERMAGRDKRDEKNQDERRDGRRDDRMERSQVQEKRAGCRHPASLPACLLACLSVFAFLLRLSCVVSVIVEEALLVDEVVLPAAELELRPDIATIEHYADALVRVASSDIENSVSFAHVRIDENVVGECLV